MSARRTCLLLAAVLALSGSACDPLTAGSPAGEGAAGTGRTGATGGAEGPVPEATAVAPVCDAIRPTVDGFGLAPDMEYDPRSAEGYGGGPGGYCVVTSDTMLEDLRGYSLEVTAKVDAGGVASMAERIEVFEPLPGEPESHEQVDVEGADRAFLGPNLGGIVMVYAFRANLEVFVNYRDSELGDEVLLDQAKAVAAATIAANTFEPR